MTATAPDPPSGAPSAAGRPRGPVEVFLPDTYTTGVPYATFRELRRTGPVCWIDEPAVGPWPPGPGYWAVFRHRDVKRVLRSPDVFSSYLGATQIRDPDTERDLEFVRAMMLNQDPAPPTAEGTPRGHSRLRRIVAAAFTPRAVRELESVIEARARALVAEVAADGRTDFVALAADLPVWTLAHLMGVPERDRRLLFDWADRVIGYQDAEHARSDTAATGDLSPMGRAAIAHRPATLTRPDGRPVNPRSREALSDMFGYAHALAERPRPGSVLARARQGGLTRDEFENMFFLFAVAGNETLRNGIPGGLLTLLDHPGQHALLLRRPELVDGAVEEMLRHWPPVIHFRRTATRDVELGGRLIRRGEKVVVYHASANRDETVFTDPDRFDITRPNAGDHLSFGHGPHFCPGARLARVQMRAMLRGTLQGLPGLRRDGPAVRLTSNFQNGLKHLPVRWETDR
ncbi:cytochrome P450 [Streptomyces sp. NPDC018031]|uniref:cytochrome P450 n=1 Tax=Streptomyces sp. NPDC018031 TaxID=3365033 RepID=UPI0037B2CBB2